MTNHVAAFIRKGANSKHKELSNKKPQFLLQKPKKTLVFVAKTIQKYDARHNEDGFVVFQRYLGTLAQNYCKYDQFAELKKSFEIQNGFISVLKRVNFQDETAIK
jgi:hypothetical protein